MANKVASQISICNGTSMILQDFIFTKTLAHIICYSRCRSSQQIRASFKFLTHMPSYRDLL